MSQRTRPTPQRAANLRLVATATAPCEAGEATATPPPNPPPNTSPRARAHGRTVTVESLTPILEIRTPVKGGYVRRTYVRGHGSGIPALSTVTATDCEGHRWR